MMNIFYDLPPDLQDALREKAGGTSVYVPKTVRRTRQEIDRAIKENGGVALAAASLRVSRQAIYMRIRRK